MIDLLLATLPPVEIATDEPFFLGSANFWFGVVAGVVCGVFVWPILQRILRKG